MHFLLDSDFLSILADNDFTAILPLLEVSSTLRKFILSHILTISNFCRFLRENQYVLHHDTTFRKVVPPQQVSWLSLCFETLRKRHGNRFYEKTFDILGPLLSHLPFRAFKKRSSLPENFSIPDFDHKGRYY